MEQQPQLSDTQLDRQLESKVERLLQLLKSFGSCAVAFSGGLDSTVLAKAAQLALGDRAVAVTGVSASLAAGELDECRRLAELIGIRHVVIETGELSDPNYRRNDANRCYFCKSDLFERIEKLAQELNLNVVLDGSNWDDQGEHRPGIRAARERGVRSPLAECEFTKDEIRRLAAFWNLPVWNKPATPCLSSRIAYGEEVTAEKLAMVDQAERFLKQFGFSPLRVRYHKGDVARIEVPADQIDRFLDPNLRRQVAQELKAIGFKFVALDLEGFRSGSLNVIIPPEKLQIHSQRN